MRFLSKIAAKYKTKADAEDADDKLPKSIDGVKIVEMPVMKFGKHAQDTIGVHVLMLGKNKEDFESALETAKRDGYPTIYVYNQLPTAHLYLVKAPESAKD